LSALCAKTDIRVMVWKDNKDVLVIGTTYSPECTHEADRKGKDANGANVALRVPCPEMIKFYNMYMGGVDLMDQLRAAYPIEGTMRKNKWYKKLYMGIFGIAVTNACVPTLPLFLLSRASIVFLFLLTRRARRYILYKSYRDSSQGPKVSHNKFMKELNQWLLEDADSGSDDERARSSRMPQGAHSDHRVHEAGVERSREQPRCAYCVAAYGAIDKKVGRTWFHCFDCTPNPVPLCNASAGPCFANFHDPVHMAKIKEERRKVSAEKRSKKKSASQRRKARGRVAQSVFDGA
jgi:hypothetical protein